MKKYFIVLVLLLFIHKLFGQFEPPIPELIELVKKRSLPVICIDSSFPKNTFQSGTAVLLGRKIMYLLLHVNMLLQLKIH